VTLVPADSFTLTGTVWDVVLPLPSCPSWLFPQARTVPAEVSATRWSQPARTEGTVTPAGRAARAPVRSNLPAASSSRSLILCQADNRPINDLHNGAVQGEPST
jgi:hypothetical protein